MDAKKGVEGELGELRRGAQGAEGAEGLGLAGSRWALGGAAGTRHPSVPTNPKGKQVFGFGAHLCLHAGVPFLITSGVSEWMGPLGKGGWGVMGSQ